jgi:hypothetical protein
MRVIRLRDEHDAATCGKRIVLQLVESKGRPCRSHDVDARVIESHELVRRRVA